MSKNNDIISCPVKIKKGVLPNSLTHFSFEIDYNDPNGRDDYDYDTCYDGTVNYLDPYSAFSKLKPNILPTSLTHLKINPYYVYKIKKGVLPKSLKYLQLEYYNYKIKKNILPSNLTHLIFYLYNQKIKKGVLPESLTHLIFMGFT